MTNHSLSFRWPGLYAPLGVVALFWIAVLVGYECGRFHRSPADMVEAARQRIQRTVEVHSVITDHQGDVEPDHQGKK